MDLPFDIQTIMKYLPHRFPFLLVDRVLELDPNKRIKALKNVTINEPFFQGHFPGVPIMPGVLIVEAMAQAGGVLALGSLDSGFKEGTLIFFMGMDQVKFRKPVVPGDQLILEAEFIKKRAKAIKMASSAKVDGQIVAEGQLLATFEG